MCFFIRRDPVAPESVKGLPLCFGDVFEDVLDGSHVVRAVGFPDRNVAFASENIPLFKSLYHVRYYHLIHERLTPTKHIWFTFAERPKAREVDDILGQILTGITSVVAGLAATRNRMSDAHARTYRPDRHHARLAVNAQTLLSTFFWSPTRSGRERMRKIWPPKSRIT